jgi:hypothetical protein
MAQTTGAFSAVNALVEVSTNGSAWTDISGFSNKVDPGDATRASGEVYTHDGDTAIITGGKREPLEIEYSFVFTHGAGDVFEVVRAQFETAGGGPLYVRWAPKGSTTGNFRFTSDAGVVTKFLYPGADAEEPKAAMGGFTLKTPKVTKALIP